MHLWGAPGAVWSLRPSLREAAHGRVGPEKFAGKNEIGAW